jgi:predicted O-methyltransferase YrrM
MQAQAAFMDLARALFVRGVAPLGANRVQQYLREGLPPEFRPAFEYLFSRKLGADDARVVAHVEALRAGLAQSGSSFPALMSDGTQGARTAPEIAHYSSVTRPWGTFLYLCAKGFRAETILELGSCAGISGSYLASTPTCRKFVTIERSPELAAVAGEHIRATFPQGQVMNANIDQVLESVLEGFVGGLSLYYVDANHRYEPTVRYLEQAIPRFRSGTLVIFDDIHWSKGMWEAWEALRTREGFSHSIDAGRFGLCVWQGGRAQPRQYNLAKYAGWVWKYAPRQVSPQIKV